MTNNTICLLPGDGIGLEVIPIATEILEVLDVDLTTESHPIGWECFNETGTALPKSTLDAVIHSGIGLFGATSSPTGGAPGYSSPIIDLRQQLNLYANVRPAKSLPVPSSRQNIDLLIIRENTEGLYIRSEHWQDQDTVIAERRITRTGSERVARTAAKYALQREGLLTIAHKSNVLSLSDGLFLDVVRDTAKRYAPDIEIREQLVDSLAHDLITQPENYDVIVTPNMYGDIISDLTSALVGGLGVAPSANMGDNCAIYEPVHGSAPDIAGKNLANPTATILSLAMMLEDLGYDNASNELKLELYNTLEEGMYTPDLGGSATTETMLISILEKLTK
ncbi:MAG TPA: NAD-dependent isocitrate dehydrogenase [Chloroflexi bacterium]|nr:NAD-dependent isocitrate dehydrogenase [Chloroflexota bacterium]|tara:strand:+ start:242 stop:1249 length:1008 start_codon:yes stop_codon:yes gene_type:complete